MKCGLPNLNNCDIIGGTLSTISGKTVEYCLIDIGEEICINSTEAGCTKTKITKENCKSLGGEEYGECIGHITIGLDKEKEDCLSRSTNYWIDKECTIKDKSLLASDSKEKCENRGGNWEHIGICLDDTGLKPGKCENKWI